MSADSGRRRRVLKIVLPILATLAIVAPLAWLWQASRVPGTYSVMDMGYLDYGGGAAPDTGGGHGGHMQGHMHHSEHSQLITPSVSAVAARNDLKDSRLGFEGTPLE